MFGDDGRLMGVTAFCEDESYVEANDARARLSVGIIIILARTYPTITMLSLEAILITALTT